MRHTTSGYFPLTACFISIGTGVLEYAGPPTLDAVLDWAKAVDAWDGSDTLAPGWEVGRKEDVGASSAGGGTKRERSGKGGKAKRRRKEKDET